VGDEIWLDLRNIKTDQSSKKLDTHQQKFRVLEQISSHAYYLNTPPRIHPVFRVHLLWLAASDPFPSQIINKYVPPAIIVNREEEYEVEEILNKKIDQYKQQIAAYTDHTSCCNCRQRIHQ
jgi:hypothetical protein